jgi:glycolate oxidase FAD binding subunit
VIASNSSGSRRRLYGTARDFVIGMTFATLEGKLIQTGGMVVKNVAGLDMGKVMIGSFGTLAAITSVNFKVVPAPRAQRTFRLQFDDAAEAAAARDAVLRSVLQPAAIDLMNPGAAREIGLDGYTLLVRAGGSEAVLERYSRELNAGSAGEEIWEAIREFTPAYLARNPGGAVVRVSSTLGILSRVVAFTEHPVVARAGSGVAHFHYPAAAEAVSAAAEAVKNGWKAVVDFAPPGHSGAERWPDPGSDFEIMERVKQMFDPGRLLNRGRLHGRI